MRSIVRSDKETGIDGMHVTRHFTFNSPFVGKPYRVDMDIPHRVLDLLDSSDWDMIQRGMDNYIAELEKIGYENGIPPEITQLLVMRKAKLSMGETLSNLIPRKMLILGNERWGVSPSLQPKIVEAVN